jgi:peptide methionine sulfoxide reductase msrA/msrB
MVENKKAYFAGGCFWGVEHLFQGKEGVITAISGYMAGSMENPTYQDVLSGTTGHLEAVEITYDPNQVSYKELTQFFFEIHDPTQANGQGPDIGPQYLSAVFYSNEEEGEIARELEYHQDYYLKKNQQPYCHRYQKKF